MTMRVNLPKRTANPTVQISARIAPELAKKVRVFVAEHETTVCDVVTAGLRAIVEKKRRQQRTGQMKARHEEEKSGAAAGARSDANRQSGSSPPVRSRKVVEAAEALIASSLPCSYSSRREGTARPACTARLQERNDRRDGHPELVHREP
jgi:hypothetical protein